MSKKIHEQIEKAIEQAIETGEAHITIRRPDLPSVFSIHGLMKEIMQIVPLNPEQEFRIHALIKRHDHLSKEDVYGKVKWWMEMGPGRELNQHEKWVVNNLDLKIKTHSEMAAAPDEEIVTYDVGSHKYKPATKSTDSGLQ